MGFEATGNTFLDCLGVIHKLCNANQEVCLHAIKPWPHKRGGQLAKMAVRNSWMTLRVCIIMHKSGLSKI